MKIKITIVVVLFNLCSVFSQQDLIKELTKQAVSIDSLKKANKIEKEKYKVQTDSLKQIKDSIKNLKLTLSKLDEFKKDKKKIDTLLKKQNLKIILLEEQKSDLILNMSDEKIKSKQKIQVEKEKAKAAILLEISNTYKDKSFDDLISFSTKLSVERDLKFIGENNKVKQILVDLITYFEVKSLIHKQFNIEKTIISLDKLNNVKQQSTLLEKLQRNLEDYQLVNEGLKNCLIAINALDKDGSVLGMGEEIKTLKLNKILTEISNYIFNYDFNHDDYPYLSTVLSEVIKLKVPNPDKDISSLLKKTE